MRTVSLISLTMAAGLMSFAASSHEAIYAVGDLDGLSAGAKGVVRTDDDRLFFRSGKVTMETPYSKITSTELGQKVTRSNETKHKFLGVKLSGGKTEGQSLIVNFKDATGKDKTMTLELSEIAAHDVRTFVDARSGLTARRQQDEGWWGDEYWKTDRNQRTWSMQTASAK